MKEFALTLNLKDDPRAIEQYKEHHRRVWPEVVASLKKIGIEEMRIYLLGRRMFMIVRTIDQFDPKKDFARYLEQSPRCQEWEELMGQFQEKVPEAGPNEKWAFMEKVYDLEW